MERAVTIDVVITILFAIMVFLGWRSGALSQGIRIGAAVAVVALSPWVSIVVREALFQESKLSAPVVEMGALFLAGVIIYVVIVTAGWLVVRTMRAASKTLSKLDRLGGAGIGGLKAALLIYFILVVVVMLEVPLTRMDPENALRLRDGHATALVAEYNVLAPWRFPDLKQLHRAVEVGHYAEQNGQRHVLREHARAADLLRKKAVRELLEDEAVVAAALADRHAVTLADDRVRALLNDEEFITQLRSVDWDALLAIARPEPTEAPQP
jgi:hypothetical protein